MRSEATSGNKGSERRLEAGKSVRMKGRRCVDFLRREVFSMSARPADIQVSVLRNKGDLIGKATTN